MVPGRMGPKKLMSYPVGGSRYPTTAANVHEHKYLMNARMVKRLFVPLLERSWGVLLAGLPAITLNRILPSPCFVNFRFI